MSCKWVSSTEPRVVPGRHEIDCANETCAGCQPCTEAHCRVCGIQHSEGACGECVAAVRENLEQIDHLCDDLHDEVEHRGVEGEAMALLGPAADPEALGHMQASVAAGRIPPENVDAVGDAHPLFVAATWAMVYRDAFEHDEPTTVVDLVTELGYLRRNLTEAAVYEHVPFEDLAKDLRRCVAHLESVLHDSDRGERTNIDCLDCGGALERKLGARGFEDVATCRGCKRRLTAPEYSQAVLRNYIDNAEWLSDGHMAIRTGVKADTVRSWGRAPKDGSEPLVAKDVQHGRTVYCVADVERVKAEKGLAA